MMHVILTERDGKIAIETPRGTLIFDAVPANHLGYSMQEVSRWLHAKESDDPDRHRRTPFVLLAIIDPDPGTELGGSAPPDKERPVSDRESGAGGGA